MAQLVRFEVREDVHRDHQRTHHFHTNQQHRLMDIGDLAAQAQERRVGQLQNFGCHGYVARDDVAHPRRRRIVRLQFRHNFVVQCWQAGHRGQARDHFLHRGTAQQIAQQEGSLDPSLQFLDIAGLRQKLVASSDEPKYSFPARLTRQYEAYSLGMTLLHLLQ